MATASQPGVGTTVWSPARVYLVVSGIFLVVASITGFALSTSFPGSAAEVDSAGTAHIFGVFETNGWHNLAALISAALSLGFALRPEWARTGAFVKGSMYTVVTVSIAVVGIDDVVVASNAADQVVHGALAVAGLGTGFLTRTR